MSSSDNKKFLNDPVVTTIEPWLTVRHSVQAVEFYKKAFDAVEVYRLDSEDGSIVAKLLVAGAGFWLSEEAKEYGNYSPETLGSGSVRMILTVTDPDTFFAKALNAGATQIFPVGEEYGWRLGRLSDPYGHHWEIGRMV